MELEWISPVAGELTRLLEWSVGDPVWETQLDVRLKVSEGLDSSGEEQFAYQIIPIYYEISPDSVDEIPHYNKLIQTGTNIGELKIKPLVRELDEYVPEFAQPDNFTWDTPDTAGGNYASYGSALVGGKNFVFTIRAYDARDMTTYTDSAGDLQYDLDSAFNSALFVDRTFSIYIFNNWSSDRDSFLNSYYQGLTLFYDGEELTPEEYIVALKSDGYLD